MILQALEYEIGEFSYWDVDLWILMQNFPKKIWDVFIIMYVLD